MSNKLENTFSIETLEQFYETIQEIDNDLKKGILKQIIKEDDVFCFRNNISSLLTKQFLPDFLKCYFKNTSTGLDYKLEVEFFHGIGGYWKKMDIGTRTCITTP